MVYAVHNSLRLFRALKFIICESIFFGMRILIPSTNATRMDHAICEIQGSKRTPETRTLQTTIAANGGTSAGETGRKRVSQRVSISVFDKPTQFLITIKNTFDQTDMFFFSLFL
jgi:hypothetical protein